MILRGCLNSHKTIQIMENLLKFLLKSAGTSHFTFDKKVFVTYKDLLPQHVLIGDKDCSSEVLGTGDVDFTILDVTGN